MEVSKNWERNLGIAWPAASASQLQPPCDQFQLVQFQFRIRQVTGTATARVSDFDNLTTLYDLAHLNANNFAVTVGSATLNLLLTDSNTQDAAEPAHPRHRRPEGHDEDRFADSHCDRFLPDRRGDGAVVSSLVNTQFQYQDVGVKIEMTPTVHFDHDVTLKIKIEVTSQSGSVTISGVTEPIISQKSHRTGDPPAGRRGQHSGWHSQQAGPANWTGIPGLSSIPILKYIFGNEGPYQDDDEIVFAVVPHIVRSQDLNQANLRPIDTGSASPSNLRRIADRRAAVPTSSARSCARASLQLEHRHGSRASRLTAAAPALLAQMNAAAQEPVSTCRRPISAGGSRPPSSSASSAAG